MDAFTVYLNTFRYVMNADPTVKSSWCDIFKYLPCLRRMLSCSVCGNILRNPHGAANGVCLHHVCYKCLGGKMMLRPSCSWCKDHSSFKENKKLRVLVLCFKRLCAYISHSRLGSAIKSSSLNGHDTEVDNTQKALEDAEQFADDYELTPPPVEPLGILKQRVKEHKYSFTEYKPSASTSGLVRKQNILPLQNKTGGTMKRQRRRSVPNITLKSPPKTNASIHVKRLKRKALNTSRRKNVTSKSIEQKNISRKSPTCQRKRVTVISGGLLISERPHRQLSGKFSVGQLWRETFLEERTPEPEVYPDSGIEVGNSSDQDHGSHSPRSSQVKDESATSTSINEKMVYPIRDTRLHPRSVESHQGNKTTTATAENEDMPKAKPKLTLNIPNNRFQKVSSKRGLRGSFLKKAEVIISSDSKKLTAQMSSDKISKIKIPQINCKGVNTRIKDSLKQRKDICRCARFKRPNQLTCFGQKCPCYRDRKPCVNCLCNGCKNPRRHSSDSAPPLMHMSRSKDAQCLSPDMDLSMPRLSPIPRM